MAKETPELRDEILRKARAKRQEAKAKLPSSQYDQREKLRSLMALRGVTQSSLARVTEEMHRSGEVPHAILQTRISKWLLAVGEPGHVDLWILCQALRVPLAYLADPTRTEPPVLSALETELELERLVKRVGVPTALDRVALRANVEVYGRYPADPSTTYGAEIAARHQIKEKG